MPCVLKRRIGSLPVLLFAAFAACSSPGSNAQNDSATQTTDAASAPRVSSPMKSTAAPESKPSTTAQAGASGQGGAGNTALRAAPSTTSSSATALGSGGAGALAQAPAAGSGGGSAAAGNPAGAAAQAGAMAHSAGPLTLELVDGEDLGDGFFAFPESARPPMNQSPPFRWSGGPAATESYALVFRDVTNANPPVKWVLWNISPDRTEVPANVSGSSAMPSEVPGASQLGSLGNQGYAGPCCVGNKYEWIVYALDVAQLPGTQGQSTAQINMNVIPMHTLEKSKPLMLRIKD
jgi:phosphatidylethanolamine-binding protein (PEBP) family uncharacterized protein